jgi:CRISPR-associated protein Csx17
MPDARLSGCTPEPLISYLKALGVFRLVAEQADPEARLSWEGGVACLRSRLDDAGLERFFLEDYSPTPVIGPWGARSGFYQGSSESAARDALNAIVNAAPNLPRLAGFRDVIALVRELLRKSGYAEKVKDEEKLRLMQLCRNTLPDNLLPWLDAVFILTDDSRRFPPLLGTGGNEGSGSYVSTFAQSVVSLLITRQNDAGASTSLFGRFAPSFGRLAVGHFSPGAVDGPNSSQGFSGGGGVNAWDYLLAIEGCLLFAGAVARRYGVDTLGRAAFPFCAEAVAVGHATESEKEASESTRAELWLPLWSSPVSLRELSHLFAEGLAQLGRRQARNTVEFALALATFGVSRGFHTFVRYAFVMRNGLSYFAVPLGRVDVQARPKARLLYDPPLSRWIDRLRGACRDTERTPARYRSGLRQIDRAMYEFARRSERDNDTPYLVEVLRSLGGTERTLANGLAFCQDKSLRPLQELTPRWLIGAAPAGPSGCEFRLAAALASIMAEPQRAVGPLRTHLEPVLQEGRWFAWSPGSTSVAWSNRALVDNLAAVLLRRLIESDRGGRTSSAAAEGGNAGPRELAGSKHAPQGCSLRASVFAPLEDVMAFMNERTDDEKLADLLWAFIGIDWQSRDLRRRRFRAELGRAFRSPLVTPVPAAFGLIRLVLETLRLTAGPPNARGSSDRRWRVAGKKEAADLVVSPTAEPFWKLTLGALDEAEVAAAQRLWSDRAIPFGWANRQRRGTGLVTGCRIEPIRMLAACLVPLSPSSLTRLAGQVLNPPNPQPS